jgi:hypothetical protein
MFTPQHPPSFWCALSLNLIIIMFTSCQRGALGTPTNPQPAGFRHRQLTAQIQKDITSLTEIVKQRTKAVVDQSNREGYGERIGLLERVVRHTRLFVTDSLLANIDDSQFRNMLFFRLDNQKNMKLVNSKNDKNYVHLAFPSSMLLDGLQSQSQYIIKASASDQSIKLCVFHSRK